MEIEIGHYILNSQQQDSPSGKNYEIHNADTCEHLPDAHHQLNLGYFNNCDLAVSKAKFDHPAWADFVDGCRWCCPRCHHG